MPDTATLLPGRVAAQLFVLGRTAEHAELVIRLIRTVLARLDQPLGVGTEGGAKSLQVLLSALATVSGFDPVSEPEDEGRPHRSSTVVAPPEPPSEVPTDRRALALLLDAGVDGSLVSSLGLLVEAAYSVREQLSGDTWQLVGDVEEELARLRSRPPTHWSGSSRVCSGCSRPFSPWRGSRPRTWSATRHGCSSTPAAASSGLSRW